LLFKKRNDFCTGFTDNSLIYINLNVKKLIVIITAIFYLIACEKREDKILISDLVSKTQYYDYEIFNEENLKIYGKWKFIYGGFVGKSETGYEYLEVIPFGIYGLITNNEVKEYGQILVVKQEEDVTIVDFLPDFKYITNSFLDQKVVAFQGTDTLILTDNYLGWGCRYYYKRTK